MRVKPPRRLSAAYHVICPDSIGCGQSEWTQDPHNDPSLKAYGHMARDLISQLGLTSVRWIGASKGGALGMTLASSMADCQISHLVLNDIGPGFPDFMRKAALNHIANPRVFDSYNDFDRLVRFTLRRGGLTLTEPQWVRLVKSWSRETTDGGDDGSALPVCLGGGRRGRCRPDV